MSKQNRIMLPITFFVLGYLVELSFNIIISRHLGASQYGDFAVAYRVITLVAILLLLGSNVSVVRFLPHYIANQQWGRLRGFLRYHFYLLLISSLVLIALVVALFFIKYLLGWLSGNEGFPIHPTVYALFIAPFFAINLLLASLLTSLKLANWSSLTKKFLLQFCFLVAILFFINALGYLNLAVVLILLACSMITTIFIQWWILKSSLPSPVRSANEVLERAQWKHMLVTLFASTIVFTLNNQINLYLMGLFHMHEQVVGHFTAVLVVAASLWLPRNAALVVYKPVLSVLAANEEWVDLQKFAQHSARVMTLISLVMLVILFIFSKQILHLFGPDFVVAKWPLRITALGFCARSFCVTVKPILQYAGHEKKNLLAQSVSLVINIIMSVVFIPFYGIMGAAIALAVSRVLLVIWQAVLVKRLLQTNTFII